MSRVVLQFHQPLALTKASPWHRLAPTHQLRCCTAAPGSQLARTRCSVAPVLPHMDASTAFSASSAHDLATLAYLAAAAAIPLLQPAQASFTVELGWFTSGPGGPHGH